MILIQFFFVVVFVIMFFLSRGFWILKLCSYLGNRELRLEKMYVMQKLLLSEIIATEALKGKKGKKEIKEACRERMSQFATFDLEGLSFYCDEILNGRVHEIRL
jgi:hypothetical protein